MGAGTVWVVLGLRCLAPNCVHLLVPMQYDRSTQHACAADVFCGVTGCRPFQYQHNSEYVVWVMFPGSNHGV
jgi:hypothetical protein